MKSLPIALVATGALLCPLAAFPQALEEGGYVSVYLGQAKSEELKDVSNCNRDLPDSERVCEGDSHLSGGFGFGLMFNSHFGAELMIRSFNDESLPAFVGIGSFPVSDGIALFAKLGVAQINHDAKYDDGNEVDVDDGFVATGYIGALFQLDDQWAGSIDYGHSGGDINSINLGLHLRF